jgi:prepilin-type N-terminal cleavage/methylation domain-containing protein
MKRETGFTLLEVLVAMVVMLVIMAATLGALTDAIHATQGVTLMADTQENLRAGMNYIIRDLTQAGEGIPQNGITIPANTVIWPGTGGKFPSSWTAIPAIAPGYQLGPVTSTSGNATDTLTLIYGDTTLQDTNGNWLNKYPVNLASSCPKGSVTKSGSTTTITFDPSCININTGNTALAAGDLILLQNNASTCTDANSVIGSASCDASTQGTSMALLYVSNVSLGADKITISPGDPFGLNGASVLPSGTVTATRVWMITYYIDNTDATRPQLMREVNLKGAIAVGDVIENLQVFYDILNPGASPVAFAATQLESPTYAQLPYIRDAYVFLGARSSDTYTPTAKYFRNNLETAVSIRSLNFYNKFN